MSIVAVAASASGWHITAAPPQVSMSAETAPPWMTPVRGSPTSAASYGIEITATPSPISSRRIPSACENGIASMNCRAIRAMSAPPASALPPLSAIAAAIRSVRFSPHTSRPARPDASPTSARHAWQATGPDASVPRRSPPGRTVPMSGERLDFKSMCARFDVTPRTLRHYEYIELLSPMREGRSRHYGAREVARMTLILRGRRWGFSLEEIRQWLEIYEQKGTEAQMHAFVDLA